MINFVSNMYTYLYPPPTTRHMYYMSLHIINKNILFENNLNQFLQKKNVNIHCDLARTNRFT